MALPRLIPKRLFSTSPLSSSSGGAAGIPIISKPTPSKAHHHHPIPASHFPHGFVVGSTHTGIKKKPGTPDLTVILSTTAPGHTAAAACFTRNAFKAAPVLVSDEILARNGGYVRGVVVNSGCANAVTGKRGVEDAWSMVKATDELLGRVRGGEKKEFEHETLVMSTGVIGQNLPIAKILSGIRSFASSLTPASSSSSTSASSSASTPASSSPILSNTFEAWEAAAKGFMTTDTFPKLRAKTFTVCGREFRMAGMDKGAGMIHPDMGAASTTFGSGTGAGAGASAATTGTGGSGGRALHATLLGCIMTDAPVTPASLQAALTYAVDRSFNSISVDGDMSTNDAICVLANGAGVGGDNGKAGNGFMIDQHGTPEEQEAYTIFRRELTEFAKDLAQLVVRDGEGATKFVTVTVKGAPSYPDAHAIASRISTSALVKTALYGEDANWGRILAATGSVPLRPTNADGSAPTITPSRVNVAFHPCDGSAPLMVLVNGEPEKVDERRASEILGMEEFEIVVELGMGGGVGGGEEGGGGVGAEGEGGVGAEGENINVTQGEGGEGEAKYWTCDFSYEYVRINGDYRS